MAVLIGMLSSPIEHAGALEIQYQQTTLTKLVDNTSQIEAAEVSQVRSGHFSDAHLNAGRAEPCDNDGESCDFSGASACPMNCGMLASHLMLAQPDTDARNLAASGQRLMSLQRVNLFRPPIAEA